MPRRFSVTRYEDGPRLSFQINPTDRVVLTVEQSFELAFQILRLRPGLRDEGWDAPGRYRRTMSHYFLRYGNVRRSLCKQWISDGILFPVPPTQSVCKACRERKERQAR